jgi:hypothetical protein
MAKVYTGKDGRLLIDGTEQIKVSNWTLTGSLEVLETTTLGDSQRSYTPGVQEFNGSASLLYYNDGTDRNDAATMTLRLVEGNTNHDVQLTAYITSVSFGASVGEVSRADISFQGTGALTTVTI